MSYINESTNKNLWRHYIVFFLSQPISSVSVVLQWLLKTLKIRTSMDQCPSKPWDSGVTVICWDCWTYHAYKSIFQKKQHCHTLSTTDHGGWKRLGPLLTASWQGQGFALEGLTKKIVFWAMLNDASLRMIRMKSFAGGITCQSSSRIGPAILLALQSGKHLKVITLSRLFVYQGFKMF